MVDSSRFNGFSPRASGLHRNALALGSNGLVLLLAVLAFLSPAQADLKIDPKKKINDERLAKFIPVPTPITTKVVRGETVTFIVRAPTSSPQRVEFIIRKRPLTGTVEGPFVVAEDKRAASFRYTCPLESDIDLAVIELASRFKGGGVSKAIPMRIFIEDPEPILETKPKMIRLENIVVGTRSLARRLEITNTGNTTFRGKLSFPEPWVALGIEDEVVVEVGQTLTMGLRCEPNEVAVHDRVISLQQGVSESQLQLTATVIQPFAASPRHLDLVWDEATRTRRGTLSILNKTQAPMTLRLWGDGRLSVPESVAVPAGGNTPVDIVLAMTDIASFDGKLEVRSDDAQVSVTLAALATPAVITIAKPSDGILDFGSVKKDTQLEPMTIVLKNSGGTTVPLTLRPEPPFSVVGNALGIEIPGGGERTIQIAADTSISGTFRQTLLAEAGSRLLRLSGRLLVDAPKLKITTPEATGTVLEINAPVDVPVEEAMSMDGSIIYKDPKTLPPEAAKDMALLALMGRSQFDPYFESGHPEVDELVFLGSTRSSVTFGFSVVPDTVSYVAETSLIAQNPDTRLLTKIWRPLRRKDMQIASSDGQIQITLRGIPPGSWREVRVIPVFKAETLGMPSKAVHFRSSLPLNIPWRKIGLTLLAILGVLAFFAYRNADAVSDWTRQLFARNRGRARGPGAGAKDNDVGAIPNPVRTGTIASAASREDTAKKDDLTTSGSVPSKSDNDDDFNPGEVPTL